MMRVLRDHGAEAERDPDWTPEGIVGRTICMHAGHGDRRSQTVGSMVSDLRPGAQVHWVTGSSAPCLSVFKPVILAAGLPDQGAPATDRYDPGARWWRHERGHRRALDSYAGSAPAFAAVRDRLEHSFRQRVDRALDADPGPEALRREVEACWREADEAEALWEEGLAALPGPLTAYGNSWERLSRLAGFG